jgi:molecular chaperone DnaK
MEHILSKAVGIDLGTTNSAVAVMNRADTDILLHKETRHTATTPSCLWKDPRSGDLVVGRMAARRAGTAPEPIRSIKRLMGRRTTVRVTDEDMSPEQVSSKILAEMKRQIETDVAAWESDGASWVVDRAIVTVPAYFDYPAIEATRQAGELAGLEVLDLLHEPTAAACYHCWSTKTTDGTFLVYDLGGGTFDVSVVRCTAGAFEVLGISGNTMLGGDNIDIEMAGRIQEYLIEDGYAFDLDVAGNADDRIRFAQLRLLAEGVKQALSTQDGFMFRDAGTVRDKDGTPVIIDRFVEREEFEAVARPLLTQTLGYCHEAIAIATKEAGITLSDVDQVILAGGSTHIPLVRELVTQELCGPTGARCAAPVYDKVDTIVALGAAVRASATGGLVSQDRGRTVRISFRGTGATGTTRTRVAGKVEALADGVDLTGGHIRLSTGTYDDEADLGSGGTFAFTRVPIQSGAESLLSFEVFDGAGTSVMSTARPVSHSDDLGPDGGDAAGKLPKPFLLEVSRAGKPVRKELLPALTPLPTDARFSFQHPGDTEKVLFPLYQRRRRIQVIEVPVPSTTARGTEITFVVRVDGRAMITVQGAIGSVEFDAKVVDPPERDVPTRAEIDELTARFRDGVQFLKAGDRAVAEEKWDFFADRLEAAVTRGDRVQAVHDFEELEVVVDDLPATEDVLEPPKTEFDELVANCRELNVIVHQVTEGLAIQHDQHDVAKSISAQADHGERAHRNRDQRAYAEAIAQLDAIRNYLAGLYHRSGRGDDSRTEAQRTAAHVREVAQFATEVMRLAESRRRKDFQREISEIQRALATLERDADRDPAMVRTRIGQHSQRLRQIRNVLTPKSGDGYAALLPEELV